MSSGRDSDEFCLAASAALVIAPSASSPGSEGGFYPPRELCFDAHVCRTVAGAGLLAV